MGRDLRVCALYRKGPSSIQIKLKGSHTTELAIMLFGDIGESVVMVLGQLQIQRLNKLHRESIAPQEAI